MKKLFKDFLTWFKNPNPDTVLLKLWQRKRTRAKIIHRLQAKQQAEQYRQTVAKQAYLLWEADGKPDGKEDYYWKLAIAQIEGNNFPSIYQPYYKLEKRILEPVDAWIDKQAFFAILGKLGNLAVVVAIVTFVFGENVRRNNEVFAAWQTITSAHGQSGSGGRIKALEFLNSRPLRFPWIGWTKDWFWDEKAEECQEKLVFGRRWQRENLVGLSAPNKAYLAKILLCDANLRGANLRDAYLRWANLQQANLRWVNLQQAILWEVNLQQAILWEANLQDADIRGANLQQANLWWANLQNADIRGANLQQAILIEVKNITSTPIKSACNWQTAIYRGEWNSERQTYVATEPDNTNFIDELKKDKSSDPKQTIDCSRWEKEN